MAAISVPKQRRRALDVLGYARKREGGEGVGGRVTLVVLPRHLQKSLSLSTRCVRNRFEASL